MKLLICADSGSLHTFRWATMAHEAGMEVGVFSLNVHSLKEWERYPSIPLYYPQVQLKQEMIRADTSFSKLKYVLAVKKLRQTIRVFQPDIVHAHYATSYGLITALTGFRNLAISVWGSDIFDFPRKSFVHAQLMRWILSKAKAIQSTGHIMAQETQKYTSTPIHVIPFGINTEVYHPSTAAIDFEKIKTEPVIGTVKSMEKIYGIDVLIRAFQIVQQKIPKAKLIITGAGSQMEDYKKLAEDLNVRELIIFNGKVSPTEVPDILRSLDIFCNLSRRESFGMSILEASACGIPVVATHIDGVVETAQYDINAITVDSDDALSSANAILQIIGNPELYQRLKKGGIDLVRRQFDKNKITAALPGFYRQIMAR